MFLSFIIRIVLEKAICSDMARPENVKETAAKIDKKYCNISIFMLVDLRA